MIQPVQRIPRYRLLLADLVKYTEVDHHDRKALIEALEKMGETASYLEKKSEEAENTTKVLEIQSHLSGNFQNLAQPGRRFVRQGILSSWELENKNVKKPRERQVFLFNDTLVETEELNKNQKKKDQPSPFLYDYKKSHSLYQLQPNAEPALARKSFNKEVQKLTLIS